MWWPRCRLPAVRVVAARMSEAAGGDKRKEPEEEPGVGLQDNGQPPTKKPRSKKGKNGRAGERYVPPPGKKNLGISFSHQHFSETEYYFEHGLRKVLPYYFDFQTYCKGRWVGKTLRDVFSTEFRVEPIEYYTQAARAGRIRLNEQPADLNTVLKNNDFMRNTVHRHEPPVTAQPIVILSQNQELVVVDKPASIPVHPCGRFRHNTVIFILGKEYNLTELHTIHRLDRLTSGVLMFARTLEVSKKIDQQVRERQVQKEYVCRVEGEFPDGDVWCEEPILVVSYKVGVCRVHPAGKPCRTIFRRLSYNGRSSMVRCLPYTGRTHQIRVHLQYLGHPIINDPVYNTEAWGPHRAKGGKLDKTDEELLRDLVEVHRLRESLDLVGLPDGERSSAGEGGESPLRPPGNQAESPAGEEGESSLPLPGNRAENPAGKEGESSLRPPGNQAENPAGKGGGATGRPEVVKDDLCSECRLVRRDPAPGDLVMYLHALRYTGPDWEYSSPLPAWAAADWDQI
ncbi:RNA pseudouridylate synthase domain-containing protein 2 [Pristis pectinata]|uniref:RNA pseudouridylate synthase domain-containing protein 2 n=1 Tax=Pristis pectinata TaxID=685728 RepID=UPI00223E02A1|nr:RNA pseudouridylate synthase domain-containing protein 2 [Pristis pectinata]